MGQFVWSSRLQGFGMAVLAVLLSGLVASPAAGLAASPPPRPDPSTHADAYVLALEENFTSTNMSVEYLVRIRKELSGDFLWFRRAGKSYLIKDQATLETARAFFATLRSLEPEQEDLRRRQEVLDREEQDLDRQQEELEHELDRLSDEVEDAPAAESDELEARQEDLQSRMRDLEARNRKLEVIERALDAREEALEKEAEAKLWGLIDASAKRGLARRSAIPR